MLDSKRATDIAVALQQYAQYYRAPEMLQTDNEQGIVGAVLMVCKRRRTKIIRGT